MEGFLTAYAETGTEGVHWALEEDPFWSHQPLHVLKNGDHLTVYNDDGSVLWDGIIDLEYKTGYQRYPRNPEHGQQAVFNHWVHGNQCGFRLEDWAAMFFAGQLSESKFPKPLRATLVLASQEG